jgi:hypothetical protein
MYDTIEEADQALTTAALDTEADHGPEKVEEAWWDIVHAIADQCPKEIGAELIRRHL